MKKKRTGQAAFSNLCILLGLLVFFAGILLALFAAANPQSFAHEHARNVNEQMSRLDLMPGAPFGGVYAAWIASYDGPGSYIDQANALTLDASGNVYVTGQSFGPGVDFDYATIKYNADGQQQWVARYNGPANGSDYAYAIAVDLSGNVYVTGQSRGAGSAFNYATVKYDSAGQQQWATRYVGPGNDFDLAYAIAVDESGNVYVTGQSVGAGTADDYATIKYDSSGQEQWVARYNGPANDNDQAYTSLLTAQGMSM